MTSTKRTLARSFTGGEVTPEFFGKVDDVKNLTGLQKCRNFQTLPHGPAQNRPGSRFVKEVKDSSKRTRIITYHYSDDQTFCIELGEGYFRFHTNGATLLAGTHAAYDETVNYVLADMVSHGGSDYYCIAPIIDEAPPNATYWRELPADGTYEVPNNYTEGDIFSINYVISQDVMSFTHPNHPPAELRRYGATHWEFVEISFVSELQAPTNIVVTATGTGTDTYSYTVTALDSTGREESLQGTAPADITNGVLNGTTRINTITWDAVAGATRYNIYKRDNGLYGYIGQTDGLTFEDLNIEADISSTPPIQQDPFTSADNYPRALSYYEQRRFFGGTNASRANIWTTRAGAESNMSYSIPTRDTDAINFRIAARQDNTVRHLIPLQDLIVLTSSAAWMVTSVNSDSISPDSIAVRPQSYVGASTVQPVVVENTIVFAAARGGHVRGLGFSAEGNAYQTTDLSLRAPHLFDHLQIVDMTFAQSPYPIAFMTSSNGVLLGMTFVPEEDVKSWHWHDTYTSNGTVQSHFKSVTAVVEGDEDFLYAIVEREIDGSTVQYIERFASRRIVDLHDSYFVDCGVTYDAPIAVTGITQADPAVVTAPAHGFEDGDMVDFLKVEGMTDVNGKRFYVANKTADTFELNDEFGENINSSEFAAYEAGGEVRKAIQTISSGIDHLEGETVAILANGAVEPRKTVTNGSVTLDHPASVIHLGLPIEADLETLPPAFEHTEAYGQGRRMNVNQVWIRVYRSSGIFAGPSFDSLTEKKQRTDEPYGSPPALKSEVLPLMLTASWNSQGTVALRQKDPLPVTIVSMVSEVVIAS